MISKGISLIEVLVTMLLFSLGFISLGMLLLFSIANNKQAEWQERTSYIISSFLEMKANSGKIPTELEYYELILNKYFPGSRFIIHCRGNKCTGKITPPPSQKLIKTIEFQINILA